MTSIGYLLLVPPLLLADTQPGRVRLDDVHPRPLAQPFLQRLSIQFPGHEVNRRAAGLKNRRKAKIPQLQRHVVRPVDTLCGRHRRQRSVVRLYDPVNPDQAVPGRKHVDVIAQPQDFPGVGQLNLEKVAGVEFAGRGGGRQLAFGAGDESQGVH